MLRREKMVFRNKKGAGKDSGKKPPEVVEAILPQ
jgi:hypothetical protein